MLVGLNKVYGEVLYYCSLRFALQVWDFKGRDLKSRWEVGCSLVKIVYHRVNGNLTSLSLSLSLSHTHTEKKRGKKISAPGNRCLVSHLSFIISCSLDDFIIKGCFEIISKGFWLLWRMIQLSVCLMLWHYVWFANLKVTQTALQIFVSVRMGNGFCHLAWMGASEFGMLSWQDKLTQYMLMCLSQHCLSHQIWMFQQLPMLIRMGFIYGKFSIIYYSSWMVYLIEHLNTGWNFYLLDLFQQNLMH